MEGGIFWLDKISDQSVCLAKSEMHVLIKLVNVELPTTHLFDLFVDSISGSGEQGPHSQYSIELLIVSPDHLFLVIAEIGLDGQGNNACEWLLEGLHAREIDLNRAVLDGVVLVLVVFFVDREDIWSAADLGLSKLQEVLEAPHKIHAHESEKLADYDEGQSHFISDFYFKI